LPENIRNGKYPIPRSRIQASFQEYFTIRLGYLSSATDYRYPLLKALSKKQNIRQTPLPIIRFEKPSSAGRSHYPFSKQIKKNSATLHPLRVTVIHCRGHYPFFKQISKMLGYSSSATSHQYPLPEPLSFF